MPSPDDLVLIWSLKRKMWWNQNMHGYTDDPNKAGTFLRETAEKICTPPEGLKPTSEIYEIAD
jgi:hypothetical protein